jgi:hypothetical protein
MPVKVQLHVSATLSPGMTLYPFYRRPGGPQGRNGRVQKITLPPGFDPRTLQPVDSLYTDWVIQDLTMSRAISQERRTEVDRGGKFETSNKRYKK